MIDRFCTRLLAFSLTVAFWATSATSYGSPQESHIDASVLKDAPKPIVPTVADGKIAFVAARMLEQIHYSRTPFDASVSSKFLDRYLELLDPQHIHFTQADLSDFEKYRTNLQTLTLTRRGVADTSPGFEIYNRYMQRLQQRVQFAVDALKTEQFRFDSDDKILINRQEQPYPKDLEAAKLLWRERLRYEYLQEHLGKLTAKKKAEKEKTDAKSKDSAQAGTEQSKPKTEAEEIVDTLTHRYQRNLKLYKDFDDEDVLQFYLTALSHVYDPHSDYLGPNQLAQFEIAMNLSLFGIGAELRSEDGYCSINRLLPGGPATKSGLLKEKDKIIAVAQSNQPPVDVIDMNLTKAVQLIRGPKGSEVRLTIIPAGGNAAASKVVTLIRDEIPLEDQAAKARIIESDSNDKPGMRLGVIDLPSFYGTFDPSHTRGKSPPKSTTADVAKLLTKLKQENVAGIVLDLRRNGGGSLDEAVRLTGLFIKQGPVVQVKDSDGHIEGDNDDDPEVLYDGPLVVLTSRFSASASEILAGALQDYGRALLVGDISTHGKGTVQSVNMLTPYMQFYGKGMTNNPGALKVTIKKFYRASGASTQLKGVSPDIILPSIFNDSKDFGETALENPMPWDTIESAQFDHLNRVQPYVAELRKRSDERLAKDPDYAYIREDIAIYKKRQADKTVSLNEKEALKEREEADAREKARNKERLARKDSSDKVYEITLKLAEQKGLPAPMEKTNTVAKVSGQPGTVGTNSAQVTANSDGLTDPADDASAEEKPPVVDPPMAEAQRILADYVGLLGKQNVATASAVRP